MLRLTDPAIARSTLLLLQTHPSGHGKSKHPKRSTANFSEAKTVSEIFKKKISASVLPNSASSVSFDAARKDAMKGFKDSSMSLKTSSRKVWLPILIIPIVSNTD